MNTTHRQLAERMIKSLEKYDEATQGNVSYFIQDHFDKKFKCGAYEVERE